jgi:hypothetical protein
MQRLCPQVQDQARKEGHLRGKGKLRRVSFLPVYGGVASETVANIEPKPLSLLSRVYGVFNRDHRLQLHVQALPELEAFPGSP